MNRLAKKFGFTSKETMESRMDARLDRIDANVKMLTQRVDDHIAQTHHHNNRPGENARAQDRHYYEEQFARDKRRDESDAKLLASFERMMKNCEDFSTIKYHIWGGAGAFNIIMLAILYSRL